jgi:hypothetical protein
VYVHYDSDEPFVCDACIESLDEYFEKLQNSRFRNPSVGPEADVVLPSVNMKEVLHSMDRLMCDLNVNGTHREHDLKHLQQLAAEAHAWLLELREVFDDHSSLEYYCCNQRRD